MLNHVFFNDEYKNLAIYYKQIQFLVAFNNSTVENVYIPLTEGGTTHD